MNYPIGIQTFSKLIEGNFAYVDKTSYVATLVRTEGYYFLSRPRRFGKSLLLSTIEAYFEGRRDLFKGLALEKDEDLDWSPSPVLHFDLNAENYSIEGALESILIREMSRYEAVYGVDPRDRTLSQRFRSLIENAWQKTGKKVVILVDEYDKPLLDLAENPELFDKNQRTLKAFFGNLKSMDRYIRFAMLTGVARFGKVSVFSDLNNLHDISMSREFAGICGWTEKELISTFSPGIDQLARSRNEGNAATIEALRDFYDGYLFAMEGERLYNPFSVMLALRDREIEPYWFETGTPTFMAKRIKEKGLPMARLNGIVRSRESLVAVEPEEQDIVPLLFKTGYLTIASYQPLFGRVTLRFPNHEAEITYANIIHS